MKTLLTGILGFIGSSMAEKLVEDGHDVYGIVRRVANRNMAVIRSILDEVTLLSGDITDYVSTRNAVRAANPDVIIHLAALSPVRDSFERPFEYQQANLIGTMNVAHALMELPDSKNRKLISASTAEVYGLQENAPFIESLPLCPSSPYAVSKAAADLYLRMMFNSFDLHGSILRPANSYGRKFDTSFIIEYLVTRMLSKETVYVGAPDSVRDYMYVDDHISAYLLAMKNDKADGQVFNVGTGVGVTNRRLTESIADKIGFDRKKIKYGAYPPGYPFRPVISDQPYLVLNSNKIKTTLGWTPKVSLDEGLDRVIAFFRQSTNN